MCAMKGWLMLTSDDRQHGGNEGYDDLPSSRYVWDKTVANHAGPAERDLVLLWDKKLLLGLSVIEGIETEHRDKVRYRCPACDKTKIKERRSTRPKFRCHECKAEFDEPRQELLRDVLTYTATYGDRWLDARGCLGGHELRSLCVQAKSQHSIRELDLDKVRQALARTDLRYPAASMMRSGDRDETAGGHRQSTVRVRVGQAAFRRGLLEKFDANCAFSGPQPPEVLEAAHLYSFAETGKHESGGGLLMRRDLHRLFDLGLLTVDADSLQVCVAEELSRHPDYAALQGRRLACEVGGSERKWLRMHSEQSR